MTIIDKIKDLLRMLAENIHKRRRVVLALSCVVVFVTTYMLILPAFTLEKTKAAEQGGIDVPGVTTTAEDVSEEDADANDGQADAQDVQTESGKTEDGKVEDSGSKSKDSGEAKADSAQTADPLTYEDEHYTIAVDDKNSVLPENTEIKVEEIDKAKDEKKYEKHFNDALAAIQEEKDGENVSDLEFARFYDISLVSDGKEVTLGNGDKVSVNIEYDKELRKALGVENKDNIRIIHFAENKDTGKVEAEVLDNKEAKVTAETTEDNLLKEAAFDAESFSVYGLVCVKEAEEEAAPAEEKTEETAANSEIDLGTAVVSTVDGSDLPEDVDGHADVVAGKKAIAAVEKKVDDIDADKTEYKVFDIALENIDESEYKDGFKVDVTLPEGIQGKDFRLFHIHDGKVEELDVQTNGSKTVDGFTFETENFSQFVLSYTVDFEYTIDGETFYYSIEGGSSIRASKLFKALNIDVAIDDVAGIKFSDPELLTARKAIIGNDWVIKSNKAFKTEETMTVTLTDGSAFEVKVTDAQPVDLTNTLTSVTIKDNNTEIHDGDTVIRDKEYDLTLEFQENGEIQFSNDNTEMLYPLPAGVTVDDVSGTFDMDFGDLGTLSNNKYWVSNGVLHVQWNTDDTAMLNILRAADNAHFKVHVKGKFGGSVEKIEWNQSISTHLDVTEPHDANVQKSGKYNKDTDKIDYTVTVTSTGTTSGIKITDEITGSALTSDVQSASNIIVTVRHKNGTTNTVTPTGFTKTANGFVLNLPDMADGDVYTVNYSASVNYDALGKNGTTTYQEANNGVFLDYNETPEPKYSNSYQYNINYSSFDKKSTDVGDVIEDETGKYRLVDYQITANSERKTSVSKIYDSIDSGSRNIMTMNGNGITVVVTKEDGSTETRNLSWGDDNSEGKLTKADDYSWVYNPPESDGNFSYVITYQTRVDMSGINSTVNVKNNAGDDNSSSSSNTGITPGEGDSVELSKSVVSFDSNQVEWRIDLTVPKDGLDTATVNDYLPHLIASGINVYDILKSINVSGLLEGESYEITYTARHLNNYNNYDTRTITGTGNEIPTINEGEEITDFAIRFFKSPNQEGLKPSADSRVVSINVVTDNNPEWLKYGEKETWVGEKGHTNTAKYGSIEKTATAKPENRNITKAAEGIETVSINGKQYKAYKYSITFVGNYDKEIEVLDTFNKEVFEVLSGHDDLSENGKIYYSDTIWNIQQTNNTYINITDTPTGALLSTDSLPEKADGTLYKAYKIYYYLVLKNPEKANEIAFNNGGRTTFTNSVDWDGAKSSVDVDYGNPIIDKSSAVNGNEATYTIKINPDKLKLGVPDEEGNYPDTLTLTDTFSDTLSIKYDKIEVTTDPANKKVSYDYSGHTGTFIIPNETYVVITYKCNIIKKNPDDNIVQIFNRADLEGGYYDITDEYREVSSDASGGADFIRLWLLKYKSGHMEEKSLAGAKFRLLDSEKNPVRVTDKMQDPDGTGNIGKGITFTTSAGGMLNIMLSQYEHGVTLKRGTVYYLEEIEAPEGMQLDTTLYSFVISDDINHANYTRPDGVWVYYAGDILKIRNTPEKEQLVLSKRFAGNVNLTDEQKAELSFVVTRVDENGNVITGEGAFSKTIPYSDLVYDKYTLTNEDGLVAGYYKVEERVGDLGLDPTVVSETSYTVNADGTTRSGETKIVNAAHVSDGKTTNVTFTNTYSTGAYYFTKMSAGTGSADTEQPLEGAVFTVYRAVDNHQVTTYTTGSDGQFMISRAGADHSILDEDTLYYVKETSAPEGYTVPNPAPEYYFYFGKDGSPAPAGASEKAAVNLYNGSKHETVINAPDTSIMVQKEWKDADGKALEDEEIKDLQAKVTLKRKVAQLDAKKVVVTVKEGTQEKTTTIIAKPNTPILLKWSNWWNQSVTFNGETYSSENGNLTISIPNNTTEAVIVANAYTGAINGMTPEYTAADTYAEAVEDSTFSQKIELNYQNSWYHLWTNLPAQNEDGDKYYYFISETELPDGFSVEYGNNDGIQKGTITVTNTKEDAGPGSLNIKKSVTVNSQKPAGDSVQLADGAYTFGIYDSTGINKITLDADGNPIRAITLTVTNGESATTNIDNLPPGEYVIKEEGSTNSRTIINKNAGGYDETVGGIKVTVSSGDEAGVQTAEFTNDYQTTQASVEKIWDDQNNKDGRRPNSITVSLLRNGIEMDPKVERVLNADNNWSASVDGLPKYEGNEEIHYSWIETALPSGYILSEQTISGSTTRLKNTPTDYDWNTSYVGTKIWSDFNNKYNTRRDDLQIVLYASTDNGQTYTQTSYPYTWIDKGDNTWTYKFDNLPVFDDATGNVIRYKADEVALNDYDKGDPEVTPTEVTEGTADGEVVKITPNSDLDIDLGSEIDVGFLIIKETQNKYLIWTHRTPRPSEITEIDRIGLKEYGPSYKNKERQYISGIGENVVDTDHGTITVTYNPDNRKLNVQFTSQDVWAQVVAGHFKDTAYNIGTTAITNTLKETSVEGNKIWNVSDDSNLGTPTLTLSRRIKSNSGEESSTAAEAQNVTVTTASGVENLQPEWSGSGNNLSYKYEHLPKYDPNGNEYEYSVTEYQFTVGDVTYTAEKDANGNYTVSPDAEHSSTAKPYMVTQNGNDITNSELTDFDVTKIWKDAENANVDWAENLIITLHKVPATGAETTYTYNVSSTSVTAVGGNAASAPAGSISGNKTDGYKISFSNLDIGYTYYATENRVENYKDPSYGHIVVDSEGIKKIEENTGSEAGKAMDGQYITNAPEDAVELPHTGGIGTTIFYILGSILVIGGGIYFISRRRAMK